MKISKAATNKQTTTTKKKSSAKTGEFAEQVRGVTSTDNIDIAQSSESSSPLGAVESILAAQEVSNTLAGRSRSVLVQYGDQLLDYLDEIKLAILYGAIPKDKLTNLAQILREKRKVCDDPRLNNIIDEIELRVEVEVAKLTRNN
tara:strand:+ start:41 stop:475 length:435 start_codon:yes stop_codon:yes gene_type:complete